MNLMFKLIANWRAWELTPWKGPHQNTRHNKEVARTPCEQEPALQAATNEQRHTKGTSVEKFTWPDIIPIMNHFLRGVGKAVRWIGKIGE